MEKNRKIAGREMPDKDKLIKTLTVQNIRLTGRLHNIWIEFDKYGKRTIALTAERDRLKEALGGLIPFAEKTIDYCDNNKSCHDPDAECPILMGEFLEDSDRNALQIAQDVLDL